MTRPVLAIALLAACLAAPAARAETVNCMQINSLPTTLTLQGVYCLKKDLATAITTGSAIQIAANNITIDCNGYKLGGLAAGPATNAVGIYANGRMNSVVRNCSVRGFGVGINLQGASHTVEDNRLDGNTRVGIIVSGDGSLVQRNRVFDTGGAVSAFFPFIGIYALENVDVLGNTVSNVVATPASGEGAIGIYTDNLAGEVSDNRVRTIVADSSGIAYGILNQSSGVLKLRGNQVIGEGEGVGLSCANSQAIASHNHVLGWSPSLVTCVDAGGNVVD